MEMTSVPEYIYEFTNSYLHLWVDMNINLMYTEWLTLPTVMEYQDAGALFVRCLQEYKVEYWLMESDRLIRLPFAEQIQVIQKIAPAVAASSLKKVARIISEKEDNRAMFEKTVQELKNKYQSKVKVNQFTSFNEATNWITMIRA